MKNKKKKIKINKLLGKIFIWFALILMVGSVVIGIVSPLLWS